MPFGGWQFRRRSSVAASLKIRKSESIPDPHAIRG